MKTFTVISGKGRTCFRREFAAVQFCLAVALPSPTTLSSRPSVRTAALLLIFLLCCCAECLGAQFTTDFNSGLPGGSVVSGSAVIDASGGIGNSGVLKLTAPTNGQLGSFSVSDFVSGTPVTNFRVKFKLLMGGGSDRPADGLSVNFANGIGGTTPTEEGPGSGFTICFDAWDNQTSGDSSDTAPSIDIKWGGAVVAFKSMDGIREGGRPPAGPVLTNSAGGLVSLQTAPPGSVNPNPTNFVDVQIDLFNDNKVSLRFSNVVVFDRVPIAYTPISGGAWVFAARTGGAHEAHWIDALEIYAHAGPVITAQPTSRASCIGASTTFSVAATGSNPLTYQWYFNNAPIAGATSANYSIANVTSGNAGDYFVIVSDAFGSTVSANATLFLDRLASSVYFDFNTQAQFSNNFQVSIAGLTVPTYQEISSIGVNGSRGIDFGSTAGTTDSTAVFMNNSYDFSLHGAVLNISMMVRLKAPTNNNRLLQIGFLNRPSTLTGERLTAFMSLRVNSTAQPALTYTIQSQSKVNVGTGTIDGGQSAGVTLVAGNWYKLSTTFTNTKAGTIANSYTVSGTLQDMGPSGTTPGATVLTQPPLTVINADMVNDSSVYAALRGFDSAGADALDNFSVSISSGLPSVVCAPASQTVLEGRPYVLRAYIGGSAEPSGFAYQWYRNSVLIGGANDWQITNSAASLADNGALYSLTVNGSLTTPQATLTVLQDTSAPTLVSAGSFNGLNVGACFNEPVSALSAGNAANYTIVGGPAVVAASLRPDNQSVTLTLAAPIAGSFTLRVNNVQDRFGNTIAPNSSASANVNAGGLSFVDINNPSPAGKIYSCKDGEYEITAGGADIWGGSGGTPYGDQFSFAYLPRSGDFDVRVLVTNETYNIGNGGQITKAAIVARETLDPGSRTISAYVMPAFPGLNRYETAIRPTPNANTIGWGTAGDLANQGNVAANHPNSWIRLRRIQDTFSAYTSSNGTDWAMNGQTNLVFSSSLYLGLGMCAHANGFSSSALFKNFGNAPSYPGANISITSDLQPANPTISAFQTVTFSLSAAISGAPSSELQYLWQKSDGSGGFTNIPLANAALSSYTTPPLGQLEAGSQWRCIVRAAGGLSVTSAVATVTTVTDTSGPTIAAAYVPTGGVQNVVVVFSEPVAAATAEMASNYNVTNAALSSVGVTAASFYSPDGRTIVLTLASPLTPGSVNGVVVNNVTDRSAPPNSIAVNSFRSFVNNVSLSISNVVVERFLDNATSYVAPRTTVEALLAEPKFINNAPDLVNYTNSFAWSQALGNSGLDNYGARLSSYFVPPSTTLYRFYIRSDDLSRLFMNTNSVDSTDPASKVVIADQNLLCCKNYGDTSGGPNVSVDIPLTAGQKYYMEGLFKDGIGGDGFTLSVRDLANMTTPPNTEAAAASYFSLPTGPMAVTTITPASVTVAENGFVTFSVRGISGALPYKFQWFEGTPLPPTCTPVPPGLVSLWRADGSAIDSFGTNHGALVNGAAFTPGLAGQAFSFDGVDDFVDIPPSPELNVTQNVTVAAWIRPRVALSQQPAGYTRLVDKNRLAPNEANYGQKGYVLYVSPADQSGPAGRIVFSAIGDGPDWRSATAATADLAPTNVFTHVVGTYQAASGTARLYINGTLVSETSWGPMLMGSTADFPLTVGADSLRPPSDAFRGEIDDVGIFNRALSATEIASIYTAGPSGMCVGGTRLIPNATAFSYTAGPLGMNDTNFFFVASNLFSRAVISPLVTVTPDVTLPVVLRAFGDGSGTNVTIVFSERVTPASAQDASHYQIAGLTVLAARLLADGTNVVLSTTRQNEGQTYTITLNNIQDRAQVPNSIAPGSTVTFPAWVASLGLVKVELFLNNLALPGPKTSVSDLLAEPKFINNTPDIVTWAKTFSWNPELVNSERDNYGGRLSAYFVPPSNGVYRFYIRSDDLSQLSMNPAGPDPAGKVIIAQQSLACCKNYGDTSGGPNVSDGIALQGGRKYYMEALFKEGIGGDGFAMAWREAGATDTPVNAEEASGANFATIDDPATTVGTIVIVQQPPSVLQVDENHRATLTVLATAFSPSLGPVPALGYQWTRNGVDIPNANSASYTTPPLPLSENGSTYSVKITIPGRISISGTATVQVLPDGQPPSVVIAYGDPIPTHLRVVFNELLSPFFATDPANYTFSGGQPINQATLLADGKTVLLSVNTPISPGVYTVNAVNIRDLAGNRLSFGTSPPFCAPWVCNGGSLLREQFFSNAADYPEVNFFVALTNNPTFPNNPGLVDYITSFNSPQSASDNFGARIRGYLVPPVSGNYLFAVHADDAGMLLISQDAGAENATTLIRAEGPCGACNSPQGSVTLTAGNAYYVEALMVEGVLSDYLEVLWKRPDSGSFEIIPGTYLSYCVNPNAAVAITSQPTNVTVYERRSTTFRAVVTGTPPIAYQWQRTIGTNWITVPNATNASLSVTPMDATVENGRMFRLIASTSSGLVSGSVTSSPALLTVLDDASGPVALTASSLGGSFIKIQFDEDLNYASATDVALYNMSGVGLPVSAQLMADNSGVSNIVVIGVHGLTNPAFTVSGTMVDGAGNSSPFTVPGQVFAPGSLLEIDQPIGMLTGPFFDPLERGSSTAESNRLQMTAGGFDIWNNSDGFRYAYGRMTNNFDVKVRVAYLLPRSRWSKAGLMVREDLTGASRMLAANITPQPVDALDGSGPGISFYEAVTRTASGTAAVRWSQFMPAPTPLSAWTNAWIRLRRVGDVFSAYASSDGVNWVQYASSTQSFPSVVYLGLGACSHNNTPGQTTTAIFGDYLRIPPPVIITQPQGLSVVQGNLASFSIVATGEQPLLYQWRRNGNPISGQTNSTLTIASAQAAHVGDYDVVVDNVTGTATSSAAHLTVLFPPSIVTPPANVTTNCPGNAAFTIVASGTAPLYYRWFDPASTPLPNATNATLSLLNVTPANNGTYSVVVSNSYGTVTTSALLTVTDTNPPVITLFGPAFVMVECQGEFTDSGATAADPCAGDLTSQIIKTGSVNTHLPGLYVLHYNVSDPSGNPAEEKTRTVQVTDTSPPLILCPPDVTVFTRSNSIAATYGLPGTFDFCDPAPTVTCAPTSGSTFPVGTNIVTCSASDVSGNTNTCTFKVAVVPSLVVLNTNDSGLGSFRAALEEANSKPGLDSIEFLIPGAGPHTIAPSSQLPEITDPVIIDGWSQLGFAGTPLIEISGMNFPFADGLRIFTSNCVVRGLMINNFDYAFGLFLNGSNALNNSIYGNYVGTTGSAAAPNLGGIGLYLGPSSNRIGTDSNGTNDELERNVVSGNVLYGIVIEGANNQISGNYIGTDASGLQPLGNQGPGLLLVNSRSNLIGGTATSSRNVICHNINAGIQINNAASSANIIAGNFIGVAADGLTPLGNRNGPGILILRSSNNLVGGAAAGAANTIAYNQGPGVTIPADNAPSGNAILRNSIYANGSYGIQIDGAANHAQAPPVISTVGSVINTTINGSLTGPTSSTVRVEFFVNSAADPSGIGEGETFFGYADLDTGPLGSSPFSVTLPGSLPVGSFLTATTTDNDGNSSPFSFAFLVPAPSPPGLLQVPQGTNVPPGSTVTFCVTVSGSPQIFYQWRKNGRNIPDETNSCITIVNVQPADGGSYTVAVQNEAGAILTPPSLLTVDVPPVPPGDNFANRVTISGNSGLISGTNVFATREVGEPIHAGKVGGSSVWYAWTAPATGIATFDTIGSAFDSLLGIYQGQIVNNLSLVVSDDDSGGSFASKASFNALAGSTYAIVIDGFGGASGYFILHWELEVTAQQIPVIVNAPTSVTVAPGDSHTFSVTPQNPNLTYQYQWFFNGEPISGGTNQTYTLINITEANLGNYNVEVRSGSRLVETAAASLQINVTGTATQPVLAFDKLEDAVNSPTQLRLGTAPEGAAFSPSGPSKGHSASALAAAIVRGYTGSQVFNNFGASSEGGEEIHCGQICGVSEWIPFVAEETGSLYVNTDGSSFDTVLAVYTRSNGIMVQINCNNNNGTNLTSALSAPVQAGKTNFLVVDGVGGAIGLLKVNYSLVISASMTAGMTGGGSILLHFTGHAGMKFVIEASSDLTTWSTLATITSTTDTYDFTDPIPSNPGSKFYRARMLP